MKQTRVLSVFEKLLSLSNQPVYFHLIKFEWIITVNYLHWRLVLKFGGETGQQIGKIAYDFYKIYYGTSSPQPRYA